MAEGRSPASSWGLAGLAWRSSAFHDTLQSSPPGSLVTSGDSLLSNTLTGRYTIERELGRPGMAMVYLVRNKHDRPVALKVLRRAALHERLNIPAVP